MVLARKRLEPASREQVIKSLTCALILVAPAGFTEGDRKAWLTAATMTLDGVPADLLDRALTVARRTCDHPSKIIPAIMEEIGEAWEGRKRNYHEASPSTYLIEPPKQEEFVRCTPEQAAEIMREFGIKSNILKDFI